MRTTNNNGGQNALTTDKSAAVLGIHEFSLFTRIQMDEIKIERLEWGEIAIPKSELERVLGIPASKLVVPQLQETISPDSRLGIEKYQCGLKRNGESIKYSVPNHPGRFGELEIKSYRAAFSAIADQLDSIISLKKQLDKLNDWPPEPEAKVVYGRWQICSERMNLGQSEILLCRLENEFAVIERFRDDSAYAKKNGGKEIYQEILLRDGNARQLAADFKANAYHTLKYMASNLTAKAQKVVWNQFSDCRPGEVMAAISERCLQAVSNGEAIPQNQTTTHSASRRMKM
jgi:hypothetical protein